MSYYPNPIDLSIIIVNYNSKSVLLSCLDSIVENQYSFSYEVIIVDNSSEEKINELEHKYPEIVFVYNNSNTGFAAANNIGIKKTKGKYILLLNPDTIVNENSFQPMIRYLENHDHAGIVGCKIFNADGKIERSTHSFPSLLKEFIHANEFIKYLIGYESSLSEFLRKILNLKSFESYWDHNSKREVDHVTGACMMVKREAIERVGLLDEAFFLYNEEVEWSLRFKKEGYKSVFLPESNIIHLFGHSTKQRVQKQTINNLLTERYRGMFYFFQKHYGSAKLFALKIIVLQGFSLRLLSNYIKSIFLSELRKSLIISERNNIKEILSLVTKKNFDWRRCE
jgi:GT2 family glycosyltransferase